MVLLICLMGDNTWYLLGVATQTTGYYLAHVVQVGFDCEAFQGLGFELGSWGAENMLWGSQGSESTLGKIAAQGLDLAMTSSDCGDQVNPCARGVISGALAAGLASAGAAGAQISLKLASSNLSPNSMSSLQNQYANLVAAYGSANVTGVPCGSGWNDTNFDRLTSLATGQHTDIGDWNEVNATGHLIGTSILFCEGLGGANLDACKALWAGGFPRCPETKATDANEWGTCHGHALSCAKTAAYFDDTNPRFMDWWTIFYWAWWITWAPFVGFFVAIISRGRTVRDDWTVAIGTTPLHPSVLPSLRHLVQAAARPHAPLTQVHMHTHAPLTHRCARSSLVASSVPPSSPSSGSQSLEAWPSRSVHPCSLLPAPCSLLPAPCSLLPHRDLPCLCLS